MKREYNRRLFIHKTDAYWVPHSLTTVFSFYSHLSPLQLGRDDWLPPKHICFSCALSSLYLRNNLRSSGRWNVHTKKASGVSLSWLAHSSSYPRCSLLVALCCLDVCEQLGSCVETLGATGHKGSGFLSCHSEKSCKGKTFAFYLKWEKQLHFCHLEDHSLWGLLLIAASLTLI